MIREKAIQEKNNEEQKMKEDFILLYKEVKYFDFFFNSCKISSLIESAIDKKMKIKILTLLLQNNTEDRDLPVLEFYTFENNFLINYYPYLTSFCQGTAYLCALLYSFTNYRVWSVLGLAMCFLCLPVDVLIFYKEPFGMIGTMFAMVWGFIPFLTLVADAAFPEKEMHIKTTGVPLQCIVLISY